MKGQSDQMILGRDAVFSTNCELTGVNNNVSVIGGTGCGKTMSISEPIIMDAQNDSLCVTVTKRRIVDKYTPMLRDRGYRVEELNLANPNRGTIGYDPLKYARTPRDINCLSRSLIAMQRSGSNYQCDPYWVESSTALLNAMIVCTIMFDPNPTFADVAANLDRLELTEDNCERIQTNFDAKFKVMGIRRSGDELAAYGYSNWRTFRITYGGTAKSIFTSLNASLSSVLVPEILQSMRRKRQVNFERLAAKKQVLFLVTSPVNSALNCYVSLIYKQMMKDLFEFAERRPNGRLPIPVRIIADDFATGAPIPDMSEHISIFREKGISIVMMLQSESQLADLYGERKATTILNNCDTYVYMGGMDLNTAQSVSRRLNVPLDEVLYMPLGQVIVFRRGQMPIITQRYDIRENPQYQEITRRYENTVNRTA